MWDWYIIHNTHMLQYATCKLSNNSFNADLNCFVKIASQTLIENYEKSTLSGVIPSLRLQQVVVKHNIAAETLPRDYSSISRIIYIG